MNFFRVFFVFLLVAVLTGCESVTDRFSPVEPKRQVFAGDQAAINAAANQAFKRLDFRVTRSKGADLEAVSRIHSSVAFADSRQLTAKVHLNEMGPGRTEVELTVIEQTQGDRVGGTTQLTMRDHGFFQLYFATLQQVLDDQTAGIPAKKN
jgi:hypothetical protein